MRLDLEGTVRCGTVCETMEAKEEARGPRLGCDFGTIV